MIDLQARLAAMIPASNRAATVSNPVNTPATVVSPSISEDVLELEEDEGEYEEEDANPNPHRQDISHVTTQSHSIAPNGITKITVGCGVKVSANYQSYDSHLTVEMETLGRDPEDCRREVFAWIRKGVRSMLPGVEELGPK
mgnify:CR=1 FL=1